MKETSQDFLEKNMCLDMGYLKSQITSEKYAWHKNETYEYIDCVCDLLIKYTHEDIKKLITEKFETINKKLFPNEGYSELLYCIKMAFVHYLEGGVKTVVET